MALTASTIERKPGDGEAPHGSDVRSMRGVPDDNLTSEFHVQNGRDTPAVRIRGRCWIGCCQGDMDHRVLPVLPWVGNYDKSKELSSMKEVMEFSLTS